MGFASADEVCFYIGGIFETAFADDEIGPKLAGTGIVLEFAFSEPEAHVVIDAANQKVFGDGLPGGLDAAPTPGATMSMTADVGSAYWQGKVNLPMAMAKKKISVDGNVAALLKLAPLSKKLFPTYVDRLKADGRDDLLV